MTTITLDPHQLDVLERGLPILKKYHILPLSMQVRTGKTLTALSIADRYLQDKNLGDRRILFVTKKKAISSIVSDYALLSPDYTMQCINYESLHKVTRDFDLAIIDESHKVGGYPKTAKRARVLKGLCKNKPMILLSGTFSPESYSQLFHQFWISSFSPWAQYTNFYRWANAGYVHIKKQYFTATPSNNYDNADHDKIMQDIGHLFVSKTQEEAGFKQEIQEKFHFVELSPLQKQYLETLDKDGYAGDPESDLIAIAANGADKINKMAQVCGGSLFFDDEDKGRILTARKALYIKNQFQGKKIAILYNYKAEFEILRSIFKNWTGIPEEFAENNDLVFLGQIKSVMEGVDLHTADFLIMYGINFSATAYFQGRARIQNRKRTKDALVHWIFSKGGIESKIYKAVSDKKNFTYSYYKSVS